MFFIFKPFLFDVKIEELQKNISFCRVLFGIGLLHRYVDIFGFAMLAGDNAELVMSRSVLAAACSLMVIFGIFTPIALFVLLFCYLIDLPVIFTLTNQVVTIVAWGLILLGAGRTHSIDSILSTSSSFKRVFSLIYLFAVDLTQINLAKIRFFMLMLYWGICVNAMSLHLTDEFWSCGKVLQLLFVTPYESDYYNFFIAFRNKMPELYDFICTIALYVQVFWELFLLPLMYFKLGRIFVVIQGWLFFLMGFFLLNLGYLPFVEICMWILLFNYSKQSFSLFNFLNPFKYIALVSTSVSIIKFGDRALRYILLLACFVLVFQFSLSPYTIRAINKSWVPFTENLYYKLYKYYLVFGQATVNVINEDALVNHGSSYFLLYETDYKGNVLRLVPYTDIEGGRLDYLRNDLLYFGGSVQWLSKPNEHKFVDGNPSTLSEDTKRFILKLVSLDACLTAKGKAKFYKAEIFIRNIIKGSNLIFWSPPRNTTSFLINFPEDAIKYLKEKYKYVFNLSPGHSFSKEREKESLKRLNKILLLKSTL